MAEIACEQAALKTSPCERNEWFTRLLMLFIGAVGRPALAQHFEMTVVYDATKGRSVVAPATGAPPMLFKVFG